MCWWHSRYWYGPVIVIIGIGYIVGGIFWYGISYLNYFPSIENEEARIFLELYFMGVIGGSMHCSIFFAKDFNEKMWGEKELPTVFHFMGYALQILGGGVTGVFLYLAFKAGIIVLLTGGSEAKITNYAAWLIALAGGYGTHYVKQFIGGIVKGTISSAKIGSKSDNKLKDIGELNKDVSAQQDAAADARTSRR